VFDDQEVVEIRPRRSDQQVMRILNLIVEKNNALRTDAGRRLNPQMLNRALEHAARVATHDHLVCLITDAAGTDRETARLVTLLAAHNDVLVAVVFDPLEAALPDAGRLVMCEGDRQLDVDTSPRGLRDRYQSDFAERRAAARDLARQRQIPELPVDTATDVSAQLRELLGKRR
jgi:uncharacterized protein (DUF58 family)